MAAEHAEGHPTGHAAHPGTAPDGEGPGLSNRAYGRIMLICAWLDLVLLLVIFHLLFFY